MKEDLGLKFLYRTVPGRVLLRLMTGRGISKLCGRFLDSRISVLLIRGFVKKNGIRPEDYVSRKYSSFNQFFYRKIKPELRSFSMNPKDFISPCDGHLSAFRIRDGLVLPVKQSRYGINDLLGDNRAADRYKDGICLVIRLCMDNYHRYHYSDNGVITDNGFIAGELHTVRPVALADIPVFVRNCREYTVMETENFGTVTQIEVGAMLVGRIVNYKHSGQFIKGEEKGRFEYGGSTVILLLEKDRVRLEERFFENTLKGIETKVYMGNTLGTAGGIIK